MQTEIDAIFTELNEMAAEVKMAELLVSESKEAQEKLSTVKAQNKLRKEQLEARLDTLGVNTIDPNDPSDIASLEEVMCSDAAMRSASDPPDLGVLTDNYTVQQYVSSVTVNGTKYSYSYVYVTDDKGYGGLTAGKNACMVGKQNMTLSNLLSYQFSFGLSAYLGTLPFGWLIDWGVGSLFSFLNDLADTSSIKCVSDDNIYTMNIISVTQMVYIYVYLPNLDDWYLCGTKANVSYDRTDVFNANVAGTPVSEPIESSGATSTGSGAWTYVEPFINGGTHDIDSIGYFDIIIRGEESVRFSPAFAAFPGQLI